MRDTFNLIGIDPGNNTGVAILEVECGTLNIVSVFTTTIVLNTIVDDSDNLMMLRVRALNLACKNLSIATNPKVLAIETSFLNVRYPKAVIQLSQYTSAVEQAFFKQDSFIKMFRYPPKYIKKHIGAGGKADKDAMLKAVSKVPELSKTVELNRLTEHEVDALAIAYVALSGVRKTPHILVSF